MKEDIEDGHAVVGFNSDDYYEKLLVVNNIGRELKEAWVEEFGIFFDVQDEWDISDWNETYDERCAHLRRKKSFYYGTKIGWCGYAEELAMDAAAELYLCDMEFRDHMNDGYGDPIYDALQEDDYWWDVEQGGLYSMYPDVYIDDYYEKVRQDDFYQTMMNVNAWDVVDETRLNDERNAEADAAVIAQHGGARGWKAGHVANLRLAEFA